MGSVRLMTLMMVVVVLLSRWIDRVDWSLDLERDRSSNHVNSAFVITHVLNYYDCFD